jgi:hypothetical protein
MKKLSLLLALLVVLSLALSVTACGKSQEATGPNVKLLISDENNAIGDFDHLYINISSIGVHLANNSDNDSDTWIEFKPDVTQVDLRLLTGDNASTIWSGNLTAGNYTKVFIHVDRAWGILSGKNASDTVEVKIPSNKLQISKPFTVSNASLTTFVYDVTVISTGNDHSGVDYNIEPQIAKSGSDQPYIEVEPKD